MSYIPSTDFLGLVRQTSGGARIAEMPGLDFTVAALARAGLITLVVSQTAPTSNQATTAWFKHAQPSWTAEGALYLWDAASSTYLPATPALWLALLAPATQGYSFQSVAAAAANIAPGVSLCAIQRVNPIATALQLPGLAAQYATGRKLQIVDFSTSIVAHAITLSTTDGATIMHSASWNLYSTADNSAGVMLQPSPDLNAWIIAP